MDNEHIITAGVSAILTTLAVLLLSAIVNSTSLDSSVKAGAIVISAKAYRLVPLDHQ